MMMQENGERRFDLDWIRILVTLVVLVFHTARFFDHEGWHVKNSELSVGMDVLVSFLVLWIMPTFFVLSGFGSFYSLQNRSAASYTTARIKRLLVPFVFGTLILIPPQVYIERLSHGQFEGSLIDFLPRYFDGWYGFGGNFAWMGLHLWYLEFLFIFSLLTLPLFLWLRKRVPKTERKSFFEHRGALLLWALPLIGVQFFVNLHRDTVGRRDFGGWSLLLYLVFFILGTLLARDSRLRSGVEKSRIIALVGAALSTVVLLAAQFVPAIGDLFGPTSGYVAGSILRPFASWCWVLGLLGLGLRYLSWDHPFRNYANVAVLPFYMLHQTIIVVIAYFMIDWNIGVGLQFVVLLAVSFVAIMSIYEALIRRLRPLRVLFGLSVTKRSQTSPKTVCL